MKSVLISIRPKWCEKICRGEKTIEVRKTRPKLQTPFKCYIYRTKGTVPHIINDKWVQMEVGGTIIAEFTCDRIYELAPLNHAPDDVEQQACLTREEIVRYLKGVGYGWHISELKIYDKPRKLSEFKGLCKVESDCCACPHYNYTKMDCDGRQIKRPFQSWGYVEEL